MTAEFRDRIAWTLSGALTPAAPLEFARVWADALVAAGVVADPAEVERLQDLSADHSKAYGVLMAENDRLRAALHDIAALLADEWRDEPPSTIYPEGRRLYRWPGDLRTELKDILARHGIDTEEPQP